MHAALHIESLDCFSHISTRELFHDFFERRVFLPHNLVKPCGLDSCFLELLIRGSGFDSLVLACIAYQKYAVTFFESVEQFVHLLRARQARFVQNIQPLLSVAPFIRSCKMPLQRARLDSGLGELLGCARRWRKSFNFVTVALGGFADRRQRGSLARPGDTFQCCDLIPAREDLLDSSSLAFA